MEKPFESLTIVEILEVNRRMVAKFGGLYSESDNNVKNPGPLEYVLGAMVFPVFGQERLPTLHHKAAALCRAIVQGHVFHDGNKRTALESCRLLLELNGYDLVIDRDAEDMMVRLASSRGDLAELTDWLRFAAKPRK